MRFTKSVTLSALMVSLGAVDRIENRLFGVKATSSRVFALPTGVFVGLKSVEMALQKILNISGILLIAQVHFHRRLLLVLDDIGLQKYPT